MRILRSPLVGLSLGLLLISAGLLLAVAGLAALAGPGASIYLLTPVAKQRGHTDMAAAWPAAKTSEVRRLAAAAGK